MEKAIFVYSTKDINLVTKEFKRIYFGAEFCERMIANTKELLEIINLAKERRLEFTYVTPYVTDVGLGLVKRNVEFILKHIEMPEIVINDWGVFRILKDYPIKIILGRLLIKQKRGPQSSELIKEAASAHFKRCAIESLTFKKFLVDNNINRVELDNTFQGIDLDFSKSEIKGSLYHPYICVTTTRRCLINSADILSKREKIGIYPCNQECKRYTLELSNPLMPKKIILKGNTQFLYNPSLPQNLEEKGIDRLVYEPDFCQNTKKEQNKIEKVQKLIEIEITRKCDLNCLMCFNHDISFDKKRKNELDDGLNTKELINLIDSVKKWGAEVITLTGGEPFLRKDVFEIIKEISAKQMRSVIFTNGQSITKDVAEKIIESGLSEIYFSIDAASPEIHDSIRCKKGAFDKTINSLKLVLALRNKMKSKIKVYFGTIIMGINLKEIKSIIYLGKKIGIDGIAFKPVRIHQGEYVNESIRITEKDNIPQKNNLWVDRSQYELLDQTIAEVIKFKEKNPEFIIDTEKFIYLIRDSYKCQDNKKLGLTCNASDYYIVIDKDGYVRCCWGVNWNQDIGNIKDNDLITILNSDKCKKIKEKMKCCTLPCFDLLIGQSYLR